MFPFPQIEWIHEPPTFEPDQIFRHFLLRCSSTFAASYTIA